jgi:hypothetical protein
MANDDSTLKQFQFDSVLLEKKRTLSVEEKEIKAET